MKIVRLQGFSKFDRQLLKSALSTERKVSVLPFGTLISEGDHSIFFSILSVSKLKQKRFAFGETFNPDLVICFTAEQRERDSLREITITTIEKEDDFEVMDITKEELNTFLSCNRIGVLSKNNNNGFLNFFDCQNLVSVIVENPDFVITEMEKVVTIVEFAKILYQTYNLSSKVYRKLKEKKHEDENASLGLVSKQSPINLKN